MRRSPFRAAAAALAGTVVSVTTVTTVTAARAHAQPSSVGAGHALVRGVAYDSLRNGPLAGATVQIGPVGNLAAARTVVADSLGRFRFDTLPSGRWAMVLFHPAVDVLAMDAPTRLVDVRDGDSISVVLGPPGGALMRTTLCAPPPNDSSGALLGVARAADTGLPLDSGTVALSWRELELSHGLRAVWRRVPAPVRPGGLFLFCGVPTDADLTLRADAPGLMSGDVPALLHARTLVRQDIVLGAAAPDALPPSGNALMRRLPRGARAIGTIRDARGRPLPNARLLVLGVEGDAVADSSGVARLDGLPAGSWTFEARAVGYAPARVAAVLARDEPAQLTLTLRPYTQTLDRVVVRGRASAASSGLDEFMQRRTRGLGTFLTPEDIERRQARVPTDLLTGIPGLKIMPAKTGWGNRIQGRAGCVPTVFVDGHAIQGAADDLAEVINAGDIRAIEVYRGPEVPPQFGTPRVDGCEVILLWTRT